MVKKPIKPKQTIATHSKDFPASPNHFHAVEKALWNQFVRESVFDMKAGLSLLESALDAHSRARECREVIAREGLSFVDAKTGSIKSHPLLSVERDARSSYLHHMRALRLETV
jgi:phage terminase small subunit